MTKEEAYIVIENCKGWNIEQQCTMFIGVKRLEVDAIYDARRAALAQAWKVVGAS